MRKIKPLRPSRMLVSEWLFESALILVVLGIIGGMCYGSYRFFGWILGVW